jgi:uncharacterized delta-60 repeat protein
MAEIFLDEGLYYGKLVTPLCRFKRERGVEMEQGLSVACRRTHLYANRFLKESRRVLAGRIFLLIVAAVITALPMTAPAQSLLDPTFGSNGIVTTLISNSPQTRGYDAVLQPDGKIVVAGTGYNAPMFPQSLQATVVRYNTDGSLDTTFGGDGIVITTLAPSHSSDAYAVALQSDGKIVIAGNISDGFTYPGTFLARYNTDGSLDNSFDGDGIRPFAFGTFGQPTDLIVQPDGKILVAATNWVSGIGGRIVARFNSDGTVDTGFGTSGFAWAFQVGTCCASIEPGEIALRPDGRIVYAFVDLQEQIVQFNPDGTLDSSFGVNGVVDNSGGHALAIQANGKIVTIKRGHPTNIFTVVSRFDPDGSPDTTFGTDGHTDIFFLNQDSDLTYPYDVAIGTDGEIMVGGSIRILGSGNLFDFALARLNANGSVDTSFGFNGFLTTNISGQDLAHAVLVQPDGKIVLAGESNAGFTVARYLPGVLHRTCRPVSDFDNDGRSDLAFYRGEGNWNLFGIGTINWGYATDILVPADYDGDCRTELAIYRNGDWYVQTLTGQRLYYNFGLAGDIPVPADYDGDDRADPAVFRDGIWYILGSQAGISATQWGLAGDILVPGDYDGDGKDDIAIYRDGYWWMLRSTGGVGVVQFGLPTDVPVVGDYDGDGKTDIAVYRPSEGIWYLLQSTDGFTAMQWGISSDRPVPADYDGDGKTDIGVYRDGTWYLFESTAGYQTTDFGSAGDRPIQSAYIR